MNCYIFIFFIYYILMVNLIKYVLALEIEEILNGLRAFLPNYKYMAAIVAKRNYSNDLENVCSAAIVHYKVVIAAAHCFINHRGELRPQTFFLRLGTESLSVDQGEQRLIHIIYLFNYDWQTGENDFALAKVKQSFRLRYNEILQKVQIALPGIQMINREGRVSSYGKYNATENAEYKLRYVFVRIVNNTECNHIVNNDTQICGLMSVNERNEQRGICTYDGGAPLVVERVLVGIASSPRHDCDNTVKGAIYTYVPYFINNIYSVIQEERAAPQILHNRKHLRPS